MTAKAKWNDWEGRMREVMSDPNNKRIARVSNAGQIVKHRGYDCIVSHTGLLLDKESCYYDLHRVMLENRGVHEPQEEYVFGRVLDVLDTPVTMIELGSYWAYYSLMCQQRFPDATTYMIEPDPDRLQRGVLNFELNDMQGTEFVVGEIGNDGVNVAQFCRERQLNEISILHSDIQSYERHLLTVDNQVFEQQIPKFVFVSTHSQSVHNDCKDALQSFDYHIVAEADFDNDTFGFDGLLVACRADIDFEFIDVFSRSQGSG